MAAEVGIGANARPDHPLFTFCHLRRHATVAKVGDPAGLTSLQAGLVLDQTSLHHPGTAECCNRVRAIVDNCVLYPEMVLSRLVLRGQRGHQLIHHLVISGRGGL